MAPQDLYVTIAGDHTARQTPWTLLLDLHKDPSSQELFPFLSQAFPREPQTEISRLSHVLAELLVYNRGTA